MTLSTRIKHDSYQFKKIHFFHFYTFLLTKITKQSKAHCLSKKNLKEVNLFLQH